MARKTTYYTIFLWCYYIFIGLLVKKGGRIKKNRKKTFLSLNFQ